MEPWDRVGKTPEVYGSCAWSLGFDPLGSRPRHRKPSIDTIMWGILSPVTLALLLLVLGILADDHHMALALDDLALFTNGLNRRTNLHWEILLESCRGWGYALLRQVMRPLVRS